jgi:Holliday junction resolvasome RuvABC endonuclease subunit
MAGSKIKPTILGLDLSLTSTGICVDGRYYAITPKNLAGIERLDHISSAILAEIAASSVDAVIVEGYSFASRASQAHSIGELGGVVKTDLWRNGIPVVVVPPTSRAKFATGRGNAPKEEVISAVSARTGIVWSGGSADDMCDAWILEEMALCWLGMSRWSWPDANLLALEKVDWSPTSGLKGRQ